MNERKSGKILVSACLAGRKTRYDGAAPAVDPLLRQLMAEDRLVLCCPEVDGGLPVPRPPAEICGGDGEAVWKGQAQVVNRAGETVTAAFCKGAENALRLARTHDIRSAVLKQKSPSCGTSRIYDGTFSGTLRPGRGITAVLLVENGLHVFSEDEIPAALEAAGIIRPGAI